MRRVLQKMGNAPQKCGRLIIYALSLHCEDDVWEWGASVGANMWRTYDEVADDWKSVSQGFDPGELAPYAEPGHWNV
jgi:alpha-galactosidase